MEQLTFRDLIEMYNLLCKTYGADKVLQMPIYLGDDEELNGIHCAWFVNYLDVRDKDENNQSLIETIRYNATNNVKDKMILIS